MSLYQNERVVSNATVSFSTLEVKHKILNDANHYKLIILIIASQNDVYDLFVKCWREYMNSVTGVKSFFLYSNPNIETDIHITEDCIFHKSNESNIPGIFLKTTAGMSVCNNFFRYDHLLRTNLSSCYHLPRLLKYLDTRTKRDYIGAQFYNLPNDPSKTTEQSIVNNYLNMKLDDKFIFLHGAGFIISQNIVSKYLNEIQKNHLAVEKVMILPDDVAITLLLYNVLTLPEYNQDSYYFPNEFENIYNLKHQCRDVEDPTGYNDETIFHYRNKMDDSCIDNSFEKRQADVFNYVRQIRHFYNSPYFMNDVFDISLTTIELSHRPKIIDCFIFYNELDMLLYRFEVLNNVVDFFVLVESTKTFTGSDKQLYYQNNKHLFEKYNNKIVHIIVNDMQSPDITNNEQWKNEHYQRNSIHRGIKCLALKDNDLIMICDVDEIPDPVTLQQLRQPNNNITFASFKQEFYYYNLNYKINELWVHPKILRYDIYVINGCSPQNMRMEKSPLLILKGGWHLSYFGDENYIKNKIENFSHQEFNTPDILDISNLKSRMTNGVDILNRSGVVLECCPISENNYLPPNYETALSKFVKF